MYVCLVFFFFLVKVQVLEFRMCSGLVQRVLLIKKTHTKLSIFNILFVFSILAKYLNLIFHEKVHETLLACVWLDTNFLSFFLNSSLCVLL